ncbi:hypothetical protein BMS3Bbin04_01199 [bacterium BMS3Bbin04]|nr:hypothetical protein BMS3Bbin04_01199 [bacterium BMS3Bbin04]
MEHLSQIEQHEITAVLMFDLGQLVTTLVRQVDTVRLLFYRVVQIFIEFMQPLVTSEFVFHRLNERLHTLLTQMFQYALVFRCCMCSLVNLYPGLELPVLPIRLIFTVHQLVGIVQQFDHQTALTFHQCLHRRVQLGEIPLTTARNRAGDDQRGTSLVNQYTVNLINYRIMVAALN